MGSWLNMINSAFNTPQVIKTLILALILIFLFNVNPACSETLDLQGEVSNLIGINPEIVNIIKDEAAKVKQEIDESIKQQISQEDFKLIKTINEECDKEFALKTLAIQHFNTVKHLFDETRNSLDTYIKFLGVFVTVSVIVVGSIIGTDIKDAKQVRNAFREEIEETGKSRKELENELNRLKQIESEIKEKDKEINELLEIRKSLKSKAIIWISDEESKSDNEMIGDLQDNGFSNISVYDVSNLEASLSSIKQCDCMIYSVSKFSLLRNAEVIVSFLESMPRKPPLLIYTYSSGERVSVTDEQMSKLNEYRNYSISTTPGNFKSLFNGLILGLAV